MRQMITYSHTFHLQCAHFNGQDTYDVYWKLLDALDGVQSFGSHKPSMREEPRSYPDPPRLDEIAEAFKDQHGHNFDIEVTCSGELPDGKIWLCDDIAIANVVMAWDNTNLSCLPEFTGPRVRATTELMAIALVEKLLPLVSEQVQVSVRVFETMEIWALAEGSR